MSNATVVVDEGHLNLSTATLSASILGALLFALILYRQARPKAAEPVKVAVKGKAPEPEVKSLDGFDLTAVPRNEFRPFKPIYHITMGACLYLSPLPRSLSTA